jgi:WD40 repeat protein
VAVRVPGGQVAARSTHERLVTVLAFNDAGTLLAAGSLDRSVSVVDVRDGREFARLAHGDPIEAIVFSRDSRLLATGTANAATRMLQRAPQDEAAHVWELASGRRVVRLPHSNGVQAVAFSPDSRRLATGCLDGQARVFDLATARELAHAAHPDGVHVIRFSRDGRYVASGSAPFLVADRDQSVLVWNAADGQEIARATHENGVRSVAFSADGRWIATASTDRTVRLMGLGAPEAMRLAVESDPSALAFTPDGRTLVVAGPGLQLVPAEGGYAPARLALPKPVSRIATSPAAHDVIAVANGNAIAVWRFGATRPLFTVAHDAPALDVAFSGDGRWLATASADKSAAVWNASSGERRARLQHDDAVFGVAFSPDARTVATASSDRTARLWNVEAGTELHRFTHADAVTALHYGNAGRLLATGTKQGVVRVWDAVSGAAVLERKLDIEVRVVAVSPDGRRMIAAGWDRLAHLWEIASGKQLATLAHADRVAGVVFSPDGRPVTWTFGGGLRVWDAESLALHAEVQLENVSAVAFSHDGRHLATASADRTARVWRFPAMTESVRLGHPIAVRKVEFSADDRFLVAWSGDLLTPPNAIRLWPLELSTLVDEACQRLARNLTRDEWRRHLPDEPYRRTCPNRPTHASVLAPILDQAKAATAAGDARAARDRYAELARGADNADDASVANEICWNGSLGGAPREVMPICERAVALAPDDGNGRDSRGVARALLGDRAGALEDFGHFVAWARRVQPDSPLIAQREAWIAALEQGGDPLDAATLAALRKGG